MPWTTSTRRITALLDKVAAISDNLNDISVKTRGVIGDLSTNLDVISQNLKDMTGDLKNTQGLATRLLDPKGSIDTFLNDSNELYNQVDSAVKNVNAIIAQIRSFVDFINGTRPQVIEHPGKGQRHAQLRQGRAGGGKEQSPPQGRGPAARASRPRRCPATGTRTSDERQAPARTRMLRACSRASALLLHRAEEDATPSSR